MTPEQELCTTHHQLILSLAMTQMSILRLQLADIYTANCKLFPIHHLVPFCSATQNSHLFLSLWQQVMLAITCQLLFPLSHIPPSHNIHPPKQSPFPNSLYSPLSHNFHPPRQSPLSPSLHPPRQSPLSHNLHPTKQARRAKTVHTPWEAAH